MDQKLFQAAKNYEPFTDEQDEEAQKIILELPEIRQKFENLDSKFSLDRLTVDDLLPKHEDILKYKGSSDLNMRILYSTLTLISSAVLLQLFHGYDLTMQHVPVIIIFGVVLAISFYRLTGQLVGRHLFVPDRDYEVISNQKLVELNQILEPEVDLLIEKCYTLWTWVQLQKPPRDYGSNLSNAIWPVISQIIDLWKKDLSNLELLLKASESDDGRYKLALTLGLSQINKEQYLKSIQQIDQAQFKAIRSCLRIIVSDATLLYDTIMKNFPALNLNTQQNGHSYY